MSDNITIQQHGNVTRVTHGDTSDSSSGSPLVTPQESSRVSAGPIRFDMSTGAIQQGGTTRYQAGEERSGSSSVMATLQRDRSGASVELEPGNSASRTLLATAVRSGLVEPSGSPGEYRDRQTAQPAGEVGANEPGEAPEEAPKDPGEGVFNASDDADWNDVIAPLDQSAYDSAAASVTVAVLSGADGFQKATAKLAEHAGLAPDIAADIISMGYDFYETTVSREVASLGLSGESKAEFYEWARLNKGSSLHQAIQSLTTGRDVSGFRNLALEFQRHNSPQAQEIRRRTR
jgi:hypothetical protein